MTTELTKAEKLELENLIKREPQGLLAKVAARATELAEDNARVHASAHDWCETANTAAEEVDELQMRIRELEHDLRKYEPSDGVMIQLMGLREQLERAQKALEQESVLHQTALARVQELEAAGLAMAPKGMGVKKR